MSDLLLRAAMIAARLTYSVFGSLGVFGIALSHRYVEFGVFGFWSLMLATGMFFGLNPQTTPARRRPRRKG